MWYRDYNTLAMDHFDKFGLALNEAVEYWEDHGQATALPKPEIMPIDGLKPGDEYYAIIGLFHLPGYQNGNNSHLYFDAIDGEGKRLFGVEFRVEWDDITPEEIARLTPIRIDKPINEPGANFGMIWEQVLNSFYIDNPPVPVDRFRGVHIRYENDGEGNNRGHHSHYIVFQKRIFAAPDIPPIDPPIDPPPSVEVVGSVTVKVSQEYVAGLTADGDGDVTFDVPIIK